MWQYTLGSKIVDNPKPARLDFLSFNTVLIRIWTSSTLSNNVLKAMGRHVWDRYQVSSTTPQLSSSHKNEVKKIQAKITTLCLPKPLVTKLAIALQTLNFEVTCWTSEMVVNLTEITWDNVKYCYANISYSQDGFIEKCMTIVNVLQESLFKVSFKQEFLSHYCIERKTIDLIHHNIMDQISHMQRNMRKRKHNGNPLCLEDIQIVKKAVESAQDVRKYWLLEWIKVRQCPNRIYWRCNLVQYVATKQRVEALHYFYDSMEESERQENLCKAFKFVIKHDMVTSQMVLFFYEHLEPDIWNTLLERNFELIFFKLAKYWKYRYLAVKLFNVMKPDMDLDTYFLTLDLFKNCYNSEYDYADLVQIIKQIWRLTPLRLRNHPRIVYFLVPDLVTIRNDFNLLVELIKGYKVHRQLEVTAQIIYYLIARNHSHLIDACLSIVSQNGIKVQCYWNLIKTAYLQKFILYTLSIPNMVFSNYKAVRVYFTNELSQAITMFEDVFKEKWFAVKFVVFMCRRHDLKIPNFEVFMKEVYCNDVTFQTLKKRMVTDKWILDVYEQMLMDPAADLYINEPMRYFSLTHQEIDNVKEELIKKPDLLKKVLTSILKYRKCASLKTYMNFFFHSQVHKKKCMQGFLLSPSGVQSVINSLVLYFENAESDLSLRFNLEAQLDVYLNFKEFWLSAYNLANAFDDRLVDYGHPNLKHRDLKMKRCFELKGEEVAEGRRIVDANYRFLRAMVRGNFDRLYYRGVCKAWDLSEESVAMATEAGIFVQSALH